MIFLVQDSGAAGWNIGVLGEEQRLKASALDLPGQVGDPEAAVIYRSRSLGRPRKRAYS
jgi:hypothetical protein